MSCSGRKNNFNFCGGADEKVQVILYHLHGCPPCKRFRGANEEPSGEWLKLQTLAGGTIEFKEYESSTPEAKAAGVKGYPTIVIIKNEEKHEYKGARTAEAILEHLHELMGNGKVGGNENKYSKIPSQCGGKRDYKNEDYYKIKYLKYKAKYMMIKSKNL